MDKPLVLVTEHLGPTALAILEQGARVEAYDLLPEAEFQRRLPEADAVIIRSAHRLTPSHFALAPRLKVAARAGAGVDNLDLAEATRRGVLVINTPGANAVAAAEHTLGLLLAVMRNIPRADRHVREGGWDRQAFYGQELRGRTLGIIGIGRVGSRVAERARAFGMRIRAYDPYLLPAVIESRGAEPVDDLLDLLRGADVLTLHTPKTGPRLGYEELSLLPSGAVVVNAARGGLVDEMALLKLLDTGHLWGAGLDVLTQEPPPKDHPLWCHPRVVVTCHLGGSTFEAQDAIGDQVARAVLEALNGRVPVGTVNLPATDGHDPTRLVMLGRAAGQLLAVAGDLNPELHVEASGVEDSGSRDLLGRAVLLGYLEAAGEDSANLVSAVDVASGRGITLHLSGQASLSGPAGLELTTRFGTAGEGVVLTDTRSSIRLREFWGAHFDLALSPYLLATRHQDRPGVVGAIGTILGEADVNIATVELGRNAPGGEAVMLLGLDSPVPERITARIRALSYMRRVQMIPVSALGETE